MNRSVPWLTTLNSAWLLLSFTLSRPTWAQPVFWWNIGFCLAPECTHTQGLDRGQVLAGVRQAPKHAIVALAEVPRDFFSQEQIRGIAGGRSHSFIPYSDERPREGFLLFYPREFTLRFGGLLRWSPDPDPLGFEERWRSQAPAASTLWSRQFFYLEGPNLTVVPLHLCQPWETVLGERTLVGRLRVARHLFLGGESPMTYQLRALERELDQIPVRPWAERLIVGDLNFPSHLGLRSLKPIPLGGIRLRAPYFGWTEPTWPTEHSTWPERAMQLDHVYSSQSGVRAKRLAIPGSDHYPILISPASCSDNLSHSW